MSIYFDETHRFPSCAEQFANLEEWLETSPLWQQKRVRAADLHRRLNAAQRRELIGYLSTGLVRAFTTHVFVQLRFGEDKSFSTIDEALRWVGDWRYEGAEEAFHGCFSVPKSLWENDHSESTEWVGETGYPWMTGSIANWSIGKFGSLYERSNINDWGNEPEKKGATGQLVCLAVEFLESDIEAVFGKLGGARSSRGTKYDWEAAFADVAAAFYHDVEFESLEAQGVQKKVIELLRSSFEKRGLAVPSDDTLKPKARAILGALRAK